jgi:hypothetical protein
MIPGHGPLRRRASNLPASGTGCSTVTGPADRRGRRPPRYRGQLRCTDRREVRVARHVPALGEPVPTPMWFGLPNGRLYVESRQQRPHRPVTRKSQWQMLGLDHRPAKHPSLIPSEQDQTVCLVSERPQHPIGSSHDHRAKTDTALSPRQPRDQTAACWPRGPATTAARVCSFVRADVGLGAFGHVASGGCKRVVLRRPRAISPVSASRHARRRSATQAR